MPRKVRDQNQMFQDHQDEWVLYFNCVFCLSYWFLHLGAVIFLPTCLDNQLPFLASLPLRFPVLELLMPLLLFYDKSLLLLYCIFGAPFFTRLHLVFVNCSELQKLDWFRWRIVSQRAMFELNFVKATSNLSVLKASFKRSNKLIKLDPCVFILPDIRFWP